MHTKARALTFKEIALSLVREIVPIGLFVFLFALAAHIRLYLPFSPVPVTFHRLESEVSISAPNAL